MLTISIVYLPAFGCCHYIFGALGRRCVAAASVCGVFADVVGQRDAGGLEDIADLAGDVGPRGDDLAALFDGCLLEPVEIAPQFDRSNRRIAITACREVLRMDQPQKAALNRSAQDGS